MELSLAGINWIAVGACIVAGQVLLTVWFAAIFAKPWARAYGVDDPKQHTREVPGYTYAIGLACTALATVGIAVLQAALGARGAGDGAALGLLLALCFGAATAVPGYAFLKRWSACGLAVGSQAMLIMAVSAVLAIWR